MNVPKDNFKNISILNSNNGLLPHHNNKYDFILNTLWFEKEWRKVEISVLRSPHLLFLPFSGLQNTISYVTNRKFGCAVILVGDASETSKYFY